MEYRDKSGRLIWLAPSDIFYNREQVVWILECITLLKEGVYPPEPMEACETGRSKMAYFVIPVEIAAEVMRRVAFCGLDRFLIELKYVSEMSEEEIARNIHLKEDEIISRINRCIGYVGSGSIPRWVNTPKRRGRSYQEWCSHRGGR